MKYKFNYDLENEIQQAQEVASELEWYEEKGYNVVLPKTISKQSTKKEIAKVVKEEFFDNEIRFQNVSEDVRKLTNENKSNLDSFFDAFEYEIPKEVEVFFTAYGSGGGYNLPNKVFILISDSAQNIFKTIIHEVIHLIIEKPLIQKHNISHWRKEMLVDILCGSSILDEIFRKNQIQNNSENIPIEYISKLKFNRKDTLNYEPFLEKKSPLK